MRIASVLRWSLLSLLLLAGAMVGGAIGTNIYAKILLAPLKGAGIPPSEWSRPYWTLIAVGGIIAAAVLLLVVLYWSIGIMKVRDLKQSKRASLAMKVTIIGAPMIIGWIFVASTWGLMPRSPHW